jgi:hypothetical protein
MGVIINNLNETFSVFKDFTDFSRLKEALTPSLQAKLKYL